MRKYKLVLVALFFWFCAVASGQFLTDGTQYDGSSLPPNTLVFTFDDGTGLPPLFGKSQTISIIDLMTGYGYPQAYMRVVCRYVSQWRDPANFSLCAPFGNTVQGMDIESYIIVKGQVVANHSVNHDNLLSLMNDPAKVLSEIKLAAQFLQPFMIDGLCVVRLPGFNYSSAMGTLFNSDPVTAQCLGPLNADVFGATIWKGVAVTNDWEWYLNGFSWQDCADFITQQILDNCTETHGHGCVVLLHDLDFTDFEYQLLIRLLHNLGMDQTPSPFRGDHVTAIAGILGATRLGALQQWFAEFGDNDGSGPVVVGRVAGGKKIAACKLRTSQTVWCALPAVVADGSPVLAPATPWITIADTDWANSDFRFLLADVNGDGADDFVYRTSQGIWVALSNGSDGFAQPTLWLPQSFLPQGAVLAGMYLGNFTSPVVGYKDLLLATSKGNYLFKNLEGLGVLLFGFGQLVLADMPIGIDPTTLHIGDLNGDGLDDVVVRDLSGHRILAALASANGFSPFQPSMDMAGQMNATGWNDPTNEATFHVVHIGGRTLLTAGTPTGIIYSAAVSGTDPALLTFSNAWRHVCNQCYTNSTLQTWHPEWRTTGLLWGSVDGSPNDSAIFVRPNGLEVAIPPVK